MIDPARVAALLSTLVLASGVAHARVELEEEALRAWADQTFEASIAAKRLSGVAMAVVQDGRVVFLKSYGVADVETGEPVDPVSTRVQIGSISKTFTATAIAQLLDRGIIRSLDDPANRYLKRTRLPRSNGQDITVWQLLTHSAGFDDRTFALGADEPVAYPIPGEELDRLRPAYLRAPGTDSVYSNFSIGMLGVIVEDQTGQTLASYLRDQVFLPLGMQHSRLPTDVTLHKGLAQPYAFLKDGSPQKLALMALHPFIGAAGGVESSAYDMAQYMNAHLGFAPEDSQFMSPQVRKLMQTRHTGNHPAVSGFGMTFFLYDWNGEPIAEHGGGWDGFPNVMVLFPESNAGVFFGVIAGRPRLGISGMLSQAFDSTDNGAKPAGPPMNLFELRSLFLTHLLGDYKVPKQAQWSPIDAATRRVGDYVGTYWGNRRAHGTMETFFDLLSPSLVTVSLEGKEALRIRGEAPFVPIARDVFALERPTGDRYYAFTRDVEGNVQSLVHWYSLERLERVSAAFNPVLLKSVLNLGLLLALTGILAVFWRKQGRLALVARVTLAAMTALAVAAVILMTMKTAAGETMIVDYSLGHTWRFIALMLVANAFAAATLVALGATVIGWRSGTWRENRWGLVLGIHTTLLALTGAGIVWVCAAGRLIGWNPP